MKIYNVLVFPCGTEIANEIINALAYHKYFKPVLASSEKNSFCNFRNRPVHYLPYVTDKNFTSVLKNLISELSINFIIPAHDDVAYHLSNIESEIDAQVIGQSAKVNEIVRFKDKTYNYFKDLLPISAIFEKEEEILFPIFVKPKRGQGSQNSFLIQDRETFEQFKKKYKSDDFVWMEYLDGEEYTIDCFSDKGKLLYFGARTREKTTRGISVQSTLVTEPGLNEQFRKYAVTISEKLGMHGIWFYQMKKDRHGDLKLLEVGPRVSGTMMLNRARGVNFVELAIYQKLGYNVEVVYNNIEVSVARALAPVFKLDMQYDNLYIDFDDTLFLDEKYLNPDLMRLVFQAKNQGKKVYLITKNRKNNLAKALHNFGIANIFDDIIHLREDEKKVDHMKSSALLIDDSFKERKEAIENGFYAMGNDGISVLDSLKC